MTARLRIVLVEPREAGNVGAVARVMKNFGFADLHLVGRMPQLQPVAAWWASGAEDLVGAAVIHSSLADALGDVQLTIATTSARNRDLEELLAPADVAGVRNEMTGDQTLAVIFGREDRGLTSSELGLAQRRASIPTADDFPTMNLAQSVGVFCYAARLAAAEGRGKARELPPVELLERVHKEAKELLIDVGFLDSSDPDRIYDELRQLSGRALPDERETTILLGILRQIRWALKQ